MSSPILSREQIRAYDRDAIERCHVPGLILMENAGRGAAEIIAERAEGRVVIVAGRGNNGGDGFVVARHLAAGGDEVEVLLLGERDGVAGDARQNLDAWVGLGGSLVELGDDLTPLEEALASADLAVDALFGTGLTRPLEGRYAAAVEALNRAACPVVALDIPSGIDADRGAVLGVAVEAVATITFAHLKAGLVQGAALRHIGSLYQVELGIPDDEVLAKVGAVARVIGEEEVARALGQRPPDSHKYSAGSVLVVAGSAGKTGAALLAGRGALAAGAGMVTLATWPEAVPSLEGRVLEMMTLALDEADLPACLDRALERRRAVAMGPGLGLDDRARRACEHVALGWEGPVVLDADAISVFAGRPEALRAAPGPRVITPHSGELARLLGTTSAAIEDDRLAAAATAAERTGATVVLKGHRTIVASGTRRDVCMIGHPVLATAGSGDVLAGVVAALLVGADPHEAACAAVYLHALSGDRWHERVGADRGMTAGEIAAGLPDAIASFQA
ncbi:MAG: NAD(P)H-hydrate dehydratase [Polyangiaceae bacterium]